MYQLNTFIGHLGRDPEMRYMDDGSAVTNFSVAVNRRVRGEDSTMWVRVSAWGKTAENVNQYLRKGSKVLVQGELNFDPGTGGPRLWKRQDNTIGSSFEMSASRVVFLDSKAESETVGRAAGQPVVDGQLDSIPF